MIYEVCTLCTEHLRDGTFGVNALRTTVPLAPTDLPIEPIAVVSEFEVPYLPGASIPAEAYEQGPLLLVRRSDDVGEYSAPSAPDVMADDTRIGVDVLAFFPRRLARELHQENASLSALLRVVRRSIGHWLEDVAHADRVLRDVQVVGVHVPPRVVPINLRVGGTDLLGGALKCDLHVTDRWAEGITA